MPTDFRKVDALVNAGMAEGLLKLGKDVKKRAVILAPVDSGDLRKSAKVEVSTTGQDKVTISFNTAYSHIRHEVNNLHPSTRKYLANGLKSITNPARYFKGLLK